MYGFCENEYIRPYFLSLIVFMIFASTPFEILDMIIKLDV